MKAFTAAFHPRAALACADRIDGAPFPHYAPRPDVLIALRIKNFILMDALDLELEPGFNVLTGETGAGKSIVIGALSLVLGGRASAEQVRPGADEAEIEALFDVQGSERLLRSLEASGIACDGELVVRRVVQTGGRSRAYLNGKLCTAAELAALASELADVASQHESVALTDPSTHLGYLDRFAHLGEMRRALSSDVEQIERIVGELRSAREAERRRGEREAFISFQLQAIEAVAPQPGEIEHLQAERTRLRHAGKLMEITKRVATRLDQSDPAICDELARFVKELGAASELDSELNTAAEVLERCWTELRETARELDRYAERTSADPSKLSDVEERLYKLEGLLRQHGPTIEDVIETQHKLRSELISLANMGTRIAELEQERDAILEGASERARALSAQRKQAADKLAASIAAELADLAMGGARVMVDVAALSSDRAEICVDGARLSRDGIDRVEFLIAPNKGLDPKPLRRIASGGELSRALLALKRVLAECGPAGLYVFDEVDSGVGGAIADKIGRAIADVAHHHQVLCITHLAPIAAFADAHYVVTKQSSSGIAKSEVRRIKGKERTAEIARMLSGAKVTAASLKAASELIASARASIGKSARKDA